MKVATIELRKLFSNRIFVLILSAVLILNGYLMFRTANTSDTSDYNKIYSELEDKLSDDEKLQYFDERITNSTNGNYDYNWNVFYELANECYAIVHYKEYLDSIDSQAASLKNVSIFSKSTTFNYRSIIKTPAAYDNVRNVKPYFDVSKGINLALDNGFTDILCGFILLFAVLTLMTSDREQGMSALLFPLKRGRGYLLFSKLATLAVTIFLLVLLVYSENLVISSVVYGLGDISRPIQSLNGFIGCNLKINVAEYLVLFAIFKFSAFFSIGAVLSLIAIMTKNTISFYGISAFVISTEGLLYSLIHPLSIYSIFKYINLISFTKVNNIFCNYKSINFWEYPIPLIPTSLAAVILIVIISSVLSVYFYVKKRNLEFRKISLKLNLLKRNKVHSALYYAFNKSLFQQKGILIIAIFIIIFGFSNASFTKKYDISDVYYLYYANKLEGCITSETDSYIALEEKRFSDLNDQLNEITKKSNKLTSKAYEIQKKLAPEMGFVSIKDRYEQIKNIENAQIFYDTGYKRMFGKVSYDDDMKYALITMLLCIFLISPLIANDNKYRMQSIINSTSSGKKLYIRHNVICAVFYGFVSAVIWLVGYSVEIYQFYKFRGLDAPVQSIIDFLYFPISFKVWQYLAVIYLLRIVSVIISALIMLFISSKCKNTTMAFLVNFAVFALPIIVYLLGADIMVNVGMNPFLSVNVVMNWLFD